MLLFQTELNRCYNISLNSEGLRTKERFDTALQFCENTGAEFSVLQETHLGLDKYIDIKNQWEREIHISPGTMFRDGMLILARNNAPKIDILKSNPKGKYILFRVSDTTDVAAVIYAPSGILKQKQALRQSFFRTLHKQIDRYTTQKDTVILIGHFFSR